MDSNPMDELTKKLEYMFLKDVVTQMRDGSLDMKIGGVVARAFLALKPFASVQDAKEKMQQFASTFPQYKNLDEYMQAYEYEQKVDSVIQRMQQHIGEDDVDQALQVAKEK